jgi:hypothetical protein
VIDSKLFFFLPTSVQYQTRSRNKKTERKLGMSSGSGSFRAMKSSEVFCVQNADKEVFVAGWQVVYMHKRRHEVRGERKNVEEDSDRVQLVCLSSQMARAFDCESVGSDCY